MVLKLSAFTVIIITILSIVALDIVAHLIAHLIGNTNPKWYKLLGIVSFLYIVCYTSLTATGFLVINKTLDGENESIVSQNSNEIYSVTAKSDPASASIFSGTGYNFKTGDSYSVDVEYDKTKYRFDGWEGDNEGTISSMDVYLIAHFTPIMYSVNAKASPPEAATFYGIGDNFDSGDKFNITFTYDKNKYKFESWSKDNSGIVENADINLLATFTPIYYTVTAVSNPPNVTSFNGTGTDFFYGDPYNVTLTDNLDNYEFVKWSNDNSGVISGNNINLIAEFQEKEVFDSISSLNFLSKAEVHASIKSFTSNYGTTYYDSFVVQDGILEGGHSKYEIVLDGKYKKFKAVMAATQRMSEARVFKNFGEVLIKGDGETLYDNVINSNDKPVDIDIDISNIDILEVQVYVAAGAGYNSAETLEIGVGDMKFCY